MIEVHETLEENMEQSHKVQYIQCLEDLPFVSSRSNHKISCWPVPIDIPDRAGGYSERGEQTKVPSMSDTS